MCRAIENIEDVNKINTNNNNKVAYITQTTLSIDDTSEIIDALKTDFQ